MEATTQYNDVMVRVPIGSTIRQNLLFRLEEFKAQPANWDDYGAEPLQDASYQNMLAAINNTPQEAIMRKLTLLTMSCLEEF